MKPLHPMTEPPPEPRLRCLRYFGLIEVVVAMGTLALMLTGTYSGLRLVERMQRHYLLEDKALEVLDNSVERLQAEPAPDASRATAVLEDEFSRTGLSAETNAILGVEDTAQGIRATIRTRKGNLLAELALPVPRPEGRVTRR